MVHDLTQIAQAIASVAMALMALSQWCANRRRFRRAVRLTVRRAL